MKVFTAVPEGGLPDDKGRATQCLLFLFFFFSSQNALIAEGMRTKRRKWKEKLKKKRSGNS